MLKIALAVSNGAIAFCASGSVRILEMWTLVAPCCGMAGAYSGWRHPSCGAFCATTLRAPRHGCLPDARRARAQPSCAITRMSACVAAHSPTEDRRGRGDANGAGGRPWRRLRAPKKKAHSRRHWMWGAPAAAPTTADVPTRRGSGSIPSPLPMHVHMWRHGSPLSVATLASWSPCLGIAENSVAQGPSTAAEAIADETRAKWEYSCVWR